jgi:hypothetical protein
MYHLFGSKPSFEKILWNISIVVFDVNTQKRRWSLRIAGSKSYDNVTKNKIQKYDKFTCLSVYQFVCLSPSAYLSVRLPVCSYVYPLIPLSI